MSIMISSACQTKINSTKDHTHTKTTIRHNLFLPALTFLPELVTDIALTPLDPISSQCQPDKKKSFFYLTVRPPNVLRVDSEGVDSLCRINRGRPSGVVS